MSLFFVGCDASYVKKSNSIFDTFEKSSDGRDLYPYSEWVTKLGRVTLQVLGKRLCFILFYWGPFCKRVVWVGCIFILLSLKVF